MKKYFVIILIFISLSLVFGGTTGKITGYVYDEETGNPLPGANVILSSLGVGAATDMDGRFLILNVPPGNYDVTVTMIGYSKQVLQDVLVQIDLTTNLEFGMTTQVIEGDEVIVTAHRPMVKKDLTSSEARVGSDRIDAMPANEVGDLLQLQSGVTKDAGGGIHIRGGRSSEVAYWVDGIPVTDAYDGGQSVAVENSAIQELQVISGTFNAEYGNAMSGIINIVTKDGGQNFSGGIKIYGGDYVSNRTNLYRGISEISPVAERNIQYNFSGPVPFAKERLSFYSTARYMYTDGWLYGKSYFNMYGDTLDKVENVPMNWRQRITTHNKLNFKPFAKTRLSMAYMTSDEVYENFDHGLQFVPEANTENNNKGQNLTLNLTQTLSQRTFFTVNVAKYYKKYRSWRFEDEDDARYVNPHYWEYFERENPQYWFTDNSVNTGRFWRQTDTYVGKFDLTSQVNDVHLVKMGGEFSFHTLEQDGYSIVDDANIDDTLFTPYIPKKNVEGKKYGEFGRDFYKHEPYQYAAYLQDKIEFESVIINVGLRWDYFNANTNIPADWSEPYIDNPRNPALDTLTLSEREEFWWKKVSAKQQISPRLGIAYPITDKGVLHFSFGHFFQIPNFELLYTYPGYKIPETGGTYGIGGNPDLKPQKTVMYELGLKQQIFEKFALDLTGYYRDVRDWVSTGVPVDLGGGSSFIFYENKDYSNVRGVVLNLKKDYSDNYWFNLSYTFQIAEGSNSDPGDAFGALQANKEPRKYIIPLGWDQTHTLNGTFFYGSETWGATLIGRIGSGYPYTPTILTASRQGANASVQPDDNSRRKPMTYEFDLKLNKNMQIAGMDVMFFLDIFNLFDTGNAINVWGTTGKAGQGLEEQRVDEAAINHLSEYRINTIDEYYQHQEWYSAPRKIQFGINISF